MFIDYASCKRLGASYCALPKTFVHPKCSGRAGSSLFKEVLNDTWVSFPSWSEDSQFVSSRKTQYEEHIYRTEDERFEFDVVLESNRDTIKVLECVQKKMSRMPPEEAARYRLDDNLGGSSPTIHQRAIRRIYGDKSADIIDGLKRNPVVAVPLVLRRLKAKDAEWREVQKQFNKIWRDQNEKYYLKSLDHQGMIFKQNDIRAIRSKSLLNEIETLYDERHEQLEQAGAAVVVGPHLTLQYRDKAILEDAANLLIHHVKRQTSIHKEDKQKIKAMLKQNLPDIFFHPRQEMSDTESEKDEDESEKDESDNEEGKKKKEERKEINIKEEEVQAEIKEGELPSHAREVEDTESYSLIMANNHWYLFLRLHNLLCERLMQMYEHALVIAAEEGEEGNGRSESTATALRLKPKNGLSPSNYYPAFKDMVMSVLDNNMDSIAYEDTLREMFGIHAFTAFTLDKVIANAVRQLQHLVTDESSTDCWELYLSEKRTQGTGGEVATASKRHYNELLYQKKSEKLLADENCFKVVIVSNISFRTLRTSLVPFSFNERIQLANNEHFSIETAARCAWSFWTRRQSRGAAVRRRRRRWRPRTRSSTNWRVTWPDSSGPESPCPSPPAQCHTSPRSPSSWPGQSRTTEPRPGTRSCPGTRRRQGRTRQRRTSRTPTGLFKSAFPSISDF